MSLFRTIALLVLWDGKWNPKTWENRWGGNERWLNCSALEINKNEGRMGRQRESAEIKGKWKEKKKRKNKFKQRARGWLFEAETSSYLQNPVLPFLHSKRVPAVHLTALSETTLPRLHCSQHGHITTFLPVKWEWKWCVQLLAQEEILGLHSLLFSPYNGLFVDVVWPGFDYTDQDTVTPRGWQSNKTEGTVVGSSFFQPQWEVKCPLSLDWEREIKPSVFSVGESGRQGEDLIVSAA